MKTASPQLRRIKRQARARFAARPHEGPRRRAPAHGAPSRGGRGRGRPARPAASSPRTPASGADAVAELEAVIGATTRTRSRPRSAKRRSRRTSSPCTSRTWRGWPCCARRRSSSRRASIEALEIALWARVLVVRAGDRARCSRSCERTLENSMAEFKTAAQAPRDAQEAAHQGGAGALRARRRQDCREAARARHRQAHPRRRARRAPQDRRAACRAA